MAKFVTANEAAELIDNGSTIAIGGFGSYCGPDALLEALEQRFLKTGKPVNLTTFTGVSNGAFELADVGMNRICHEGLIGTIIAGHLGNAPKLSAMAAQNLAAAYTIPLGVVMNLYRSIASKKPGVITTIGLGTFADPRVEGCKINEKAITQNRDVVKLIKLDGKEYLFYPSFPIDICFIRGTYADELGNVSMIHDALTGAELEIAEATHNSGGIVIVQVEKLLKTGSMAAKEIRIHHSLVDYITVVDRELSTECYSTTEYRPELSGEFLCPTQSMTPLDFTIRKLIARRAVMELEDHKIINLGIGLPSGVGKVANEEGIECLMSLESGPLGGIPLEGLEFGASQNPECIKTICDTFDLYDGGFLDITFLGAGQIDEQGNVNVSRFGEKCTGPGGFIDISQNTKKVFFLSSFSIGNTKIVLSENGLDIQKDGARGKFVKKVSQITFSAEYARKTGQQVYYITERAVFKLVKEGIMLIEIAPGVDLNKDIFDKMEFRPSVSAQLKLMDMHLFQDKKMEIQQRT